VVSSAPGIASTFCPLLVTIVVALACRLAMPDISGRFAHLAYIAASGLVTLLATFASTKELRGIVFQRISHQLS
jgi:hypothetical protein